MSPTENTEALMDACAREEEELQFERFTNEQAFELGQLIVKTAERKGAALTIEIERNGQQLFHYAMPGTAADNDDWVRRKSRLVNRVGMSSYRYRLWLERRGQTMQQRGLDEFLYAASGGGFPIRIRNVGVIGAVAVSGLPQEQDHALVTECVREFLRG